MRRRFFLQSDFYETISLAFLDAQHAGFFFLSAPYLLSVPTVTKICIDRLFPYTSQYKVNSKIHPENH